MALNDQIGCDTVLAIGERHACFGDFTRVFEHATPTMHALRRDAVVALVSSASDSASLAVTSLGRGVCGDG